MRSYSRPNRSDFFLRSTGAVVPPHCAANFWVLLGPDYAGKSTVMTELSRRLQGHFLSYDDTALGGQYPIVNKLREAIAVDVLSRIGSTYSPDFVISLFHAYMVFLRDRLLEAGDDKPVIVDSYYYKLLAKCSLAGLANDAIFALWRSFPQPKQIIYLDVAADVAWRRSEGRGLNALEFYGSAPTRDGFELFQVSLRHAMLREVAGIQLRTLDSSGAVNSVVSAVETMISFGTVIETVNYRTIRPPRLTATNPVASHVLQTRQSRKGGPMSCPLHEKRRRVLLAPIPVTPTKPLTPSHLKGMLAVDVMTKTTEQLAQVDCLYSNLTANGSEQTVGFWEYLDRKHGTLDFTRCSEEEIGDLYVRYHMEALKPPHAALAPYLQAVENANWIHPSSARLHDIWSSHLSMLGIRDPGIARLKSDAMHLDELVQRLADDHLCVDLRAKGGALYLDATADGLPLRHAITADGRVNYLISLLRDLIPQYSALRSPCPDSRPGAPCRLFVAAENSDAPGRNGGSRRDEARCDRRGHKISATRRMAWSYDNDNGFEVPGERRPIQLPARDAPVLHCDC